MDYEDWQYAFKYMNELAKKDIWLDGHVKMRIV